MADKLPLRVSIYQPNPFQSVKVFLIQDEIMSGRPANLTFFGSSGYASIAQEGCSYDGQACLFELPAEIAPRALQAILSALQAFGVVNEASLVKPPEPMADLESFAGLQRALDAQLEHIADLRAIARLAK